MDPVSSLVAIVQLIGMYRQERSGRVQDDRQKFIDWLDGHRHEEIKNLTVADGDLSREVSDLLRQDHALLSQQLADVNRAVTESLSHTRMFANLAESTGTVPPVSSAPFGGRQSRQRFIIFVVGTGTFRITMTSLYMRAFRVLLTGLSVF